MNYVNIYIGCIVVFAIAYHATGDEAVVNRAMNLDHDGKFHLKWKVDFEEKVITFTAKVKTTGYVGLGISPSPSMKGADIVIGGVSSKGKPYFDDYYATKNGAPTKDKSQDWKLISAKEKNGVTKLKFSRPLATCDDEDVEITESTQYIIWAIGKSDKVEYHGATHRGAVTTNLLDPVPDTVDLSQFQVWNISYEFKMSTDHTTYYCMLHKMAPGFNGTSMHIVAFDAILNTEVERKHVHHAILRRCSPPPGIRSEDFFEKFVGIGEDCALFPPIIPKMNCLPYVYGWSAGGGLVVLPENVGYEMGETGSTEYLLTQMHYTNLERASGVVTNAGMSIYYTTEKREMNAATIVIAADATHHLVIPPRSEEFITVGHCGSKCTKKTLPKNGVDIFNVMLHTHLAGKKMKIRHFRGKNELPWIARDDTYDFDYQSLRPLKDYVKFLPGDHLVVECTYHTEDRDGVTIGGFPTTKEMCVSTLWVFPYTDSIECKSYMEPIDPLLKMFGMEKIDWNGMPDADPKVLLPTSLLNQTYSSVLNKANWTEDFTDKFQEVTRYAKHTQSCRIDAGAKTWIKLFRNIEFPEPAEEFVPEESSTC